MAGVMCRSCNLPFPHSAFANRKGVLPMEGSFLVLPGEQQHPPAPHASASRMDSQALAQRHEEVQRKGRLMDLGRATQPKDSEVALCGDCVKFVLGDLEAQLELVDRQVKESRLAAEEQEARAPEDALQLQEQRRESKRAEKEEAALRRELADIARQQAEVDAQLESLAQEQRDLDDQEVDLARAQNCAVLTAREQADKELAAEQLLRHCQQELQRLRSASVLDDVFDIWFDGPFGTINGLRLGRLPDVAVEWAEVNAALGHAVFLVDTLSRLLPVAEAPGAGAGLGGPHAHRQSLITRYTLHPMGSFSKIAANDDPRNLFELYGCTSHFQLRIFSHTRFDQALGMFLDCIGTLIAHVRQHPPRGLGDPPYRIEEDRIGMQGSMLSVRLQFQQEDQWTRALKYMLTNLKWLLAWYTQTFSQARAQRHAAAPAGGAAPGGMPLPARLPLHPCRTAQPGSANG